VAEPGGHPDLRREYRSVLRNALLVLALPGVTILAAVFLLRPHAPPVELLRSAVYAIPGAGFLALAAFEVRAAAWYRRCSEMLEAREPVLMRLRVWKSRSGALLVELHRLSDSAMREPRIQILPETPRWDTADLDGQVVRVQLDDDPRGPVVVETAREMLWSAPMSRRQNRVEGRLQ
jgi:hypothetical protein